MTVRTMERLIQDPLRVRKASQFDAAEINVGSVRVLGSHLKVPYQLQEQRQEPQYLRRAVDRRSPSSQSSSSSFFSSASSIDSISTTETTRSVSFASDASMNQVQDLPSISAEESSKIWWTTEDIEQFQSTADLFVKSLEKRPNMTAGTSASSYSDVVNRLYAQCCDTKPEDQNLVNDDLVQWQRKSHCRRGLESKILKTMNDDRTYRREAVVHAVLTLQGNTTINPAIKAESIRRCSERMTKPARSFARAIAIADEACMKPIEKVRRSRIRATRHN